MSIIQRISTIQNRNRAMNAVKKTEKFVLNNYGLDALLNSCDTVHIKTKKQKGIIALISSLYSSLKEKMPSFTYGEDAFIIKELNKQTIKYHYKQYRVLYPDKEIDVFFEKGNDKISYFIESSCGIERHVRFDRKGKIIQIYYEGYNAPDKSIFYGNGKREVHKYSI